MRLDMFLKLTGLIKRRSLAKEYCLHNLVEVNQQMAKAAKEVEIGDKITLKLWNRTTIIEVLNIPSKGMPAKEASSFYKVISEQREGNKE